MYFFLFFSGFAKNDLPGSAVYMKYLFSMNYFMTIASGFTMEYVLVFLISKPVSAYQMGENYAKSMGVNIKMLRIILILLSRI